MESDLSSNPHWMNRVAVALKGPWGRQAEKGPPPPPQRGPPFPFGQRRAGPGEAGLPALPGREA